MDRSAESWEEFRELWSDFLHRANDASTIVVVEGEKDRRSLKRLGVTGRVVLLHSGRGLSQLTRSLADAGHRVVVLTDWDREGGHLAHRLTELLAAEGTTVDADFRRRLARVLRGEVVHVEGLAGWARRNAERGGAPLDHWFGVDSP
ncbi:MAG: toprim domain-containing protein [Thermoplasmata archaeon]|nr:toprim domain-containing protein [Thermoplasmata archaeon]